ncbi:MAG: sigma-70 family RNA polymerase sigma factor [Ruminococcus sp.]|nr:sigma-70 family RNA polymerase sigma factor [Ruminococcus sp.]
MDDYELIKLFGSSPQKAYANIIEQYSNLVYAIVANKLNRCANSEDIEDCVSDIFVEVFQNLNNFSISKGSLKSFISIIAKRSAIDNYRRLSYRQSVTDETDISESGLSDIDEDVEETVINKINRQNVRNAVMSLKEPERSIIIHQYYYNHTIREIADILYMSVGAVQQRSLRARKRIEKILKKG